MSLNVFKMVAQRSQNQPPGALGGLKLRSRFFPGRPRAPPTNFCSPPEASKTVLGLQGSILDPRGLIFQLLGGPRGFIFKLLWGPSRQIKRAPPNDDAPAQTLATSSQQQSQAFQPTQPQETLQREAGPPKRGSAVCACGAFQ